MWTLRDLYMYLNPEYAQQWREQQAQKYQEYNPLPRNQAGSIDWEAAGRDPYPGRYHDGNMPTNTGLSGILKQKNEVLPATPPTNIWGPNDDLLSLFNWKRAPKGYT